MQYLTEQDLSSYLKEAQDKLENKELKHEIDVVPDEIKNRPVKIDQAQIDAMVNADLVKSITVSKTYRHVQLPEEVYNKYIKNEPDSKEALIKFLESNKDFEINVYVQKDVTNK